MKQSQPIDQFTMWKMIIMGIATFFGFGDIVLKLVLWYQFEFYFLEYPLIVFAWTLYVYGAVYVYLPQTSFAKEIWMKILAFWGVPVLMFLITSNIAEEYVLGLNVQCTIARTWTWYIFLHIFPTFLYDVVLCLLIIADVYRDLIFKRAPIRRPEQFVPEYNQNSQNQPLLSEQKIENHGYSHNFEENERMNQYNNAPSAYQNPTSQPQPQSLQPQKPQLAPYFQQPQPLQQPRPQSPSYSQHPPPVQEQRPQTPTYSDPQQPRIGFLNIGKVSVSPQNKSMDNSISSNPPPSNQNLIDLEIKEEAKQASE